MNPTITNLKDKTEEELKVIFDILNVTDRRTNWEVLHWNKNSQKYFYADKVIDGLSEVIMTYDRFIYENFETKGRKKSNIIESLALLNFDYRESKGNIIAKTSKYTEKFYEFDKWGTLKNSWDMVLESEILKDMTMEFIE